MKQGELLHRQKVINETNQTERAALVGIVLKGAKPWVTDDFLDELSLLADTAGVRVVDRFVQNRQKPDPGTFIGRGKVKEIAARNGHFDLVIFDDDLSPVQARLLEDKIGKRVIDRSGLILDIFARRARSKEARTQVELAQLQYLLPRLTGQWRHLERQAGGIGLRGPGETQLETDRRLVRKRISKLSSDLKRIEKQRSTQRKRRQNTFKVAIVGYTNAGKSTLLNNLTDSKAFVEDRLFATLDATVRTLKGPQAETILLIDTVGFIRKLPHHLVASFRSTLEETVVADLLLHVVDASHPHHSDQLAQVRETLEEMGLREHPRILVFNKIDQVESAAEIRQLKVEYGDAVFISALRGIKITELTNRIKNTCEDWKKQIKARPNTSQFSW
ncbi:GTPase HflX [candidate division LCP-89 bacterium B3_LCP]|uniref:GTPase HflX n=1 Tax=candidate division LCP-89 bacterium B3_LCP TaxID=2012998 RepID=A0A532V178_UNCL8|nr:MAG: GTPase HflX [candidate division LCP-89 bacterium B3_LCP]